MTPSHLTPRGHSLLRARCQPRELAAPPRAQPPPCAAPHCPRTSSSRVHRRCAMPAWRQRPRRPRQAAAAAIRRSAARGCPRPGSRGNGGDRHRRRGGGRQRLQCAAAGAVATGVSCRLAAPTRRGDPPSRRQQRQRRAPPHTRCHRRPTVAADASGGPARAAHPAGVRWWLPRQWLLPLRLELPERRDSGYRFPIGKPIYRLRTKISVVENVMTTLFWWDVWLELHSRSHPLLTQRKLGGAEVVQPPHYLLGMPRHVMR